MTNASALADYGRRTYTRNGVRFIVAAISAEENVLRIKARAVDVASGALLLDPVRDAALGFDELVIVNPRLRVDDGEEPNPEYDPQESDSRPTRRKSREDAIEALKKEMDRFLARRLDA